MARIRPRIAALTGVVLIASCVVFFAVTTMQADQLLRDGARATATVLGSDGPSGWPLFNNGRAEVSYPTPNGTMTRRIWLDDSANTPTGRTWTVVYDRHRPGRVRSLTDSNNPYPWAAPFLFAALVGVVTLLVAAWAALRARRHRQWNSLQARSPSALRIPLRRAWYSRHTPYLAIDDNQVRMHLPSIFRPADLAVPLNKVWVVDDASPLDDPGDTWVFHRPVLIPYALTTASNLGGPNLTLLFTQPQRIPALRYFAAQNLGLSRRESRSERGLPIDGISLRTLAPDEALAILGKAGVPRATRPNEWLREHRAVSHDPVDIAAVASSRRRGRWVTAAVIATAIGLQVLRFASPSSDILLFTLAIAGLALIFGLPWWAKHRDRQTERGN